MFSHSSHVMTLANSQIGVGILAMPFCFQKCGIILSIVLLILSNWITRVCCHYLIKSSLLTRQKSIELLGFYTFGISGKFLVELCSIGYLIGTCITYYIVMGDLGPQIISNYFILFNDDYLRPVVLIAVSICILPLGMLKKVDSLSAVCTASIGFYVCLVFKVVLESKNHIIANDWIDQVKYWQPSGILQCLPIFSMALSCQMQLFEVFRSVPNQSLEKLNGIVRNATWICTLVYIAVGFFGYIAFCTETFSGNILMNFSTSFGSDVMKIGFIMSIAVSFPLVIFPCRACIFSLVSQPTNPPLYISTVQFRLCTFFIISLSFVVALLIPSVELIIGLVGSTIGVAICMMFPALCFRKIIKKDSTERTFAQFVLVAGFCFMILGTFANLNAIDEKQSGSHRKIVQTEEFKGERVPNPQDLLNIKLTPTYNTDNLNIAELRKGRVNPSLLANKFSPAPPPLPVDDIHDDTASVLASNDNLKNEQIEKKPSELMQTKQQTLPNDVIEKSPYEASELQNNLPLQPPSIAIVATAKNVTQQQSVNKDESKKDEVIAVEQTKTKSDSKDELKETQDELKKAKELLERARDELQQEFAKQNRETQNLVDEKFEKVVEKMEEIQRQAHQKSQAAALEAKVKMSNLPAGNDSAVGIKENATIAESLNVKIKRPVNATVSNNLGTQSGSLVGMLSRNASIQIKNSNTTVERKQVEQPLLLPLPLLINATHSRSNENLDVVSVAESKQSENAKTREISDKAHSETNEKTDTAQNQRHEMDQENVDSIRRDILQYDSQKHIGTGTTFDAAPRFKRASDLGVQEHQKQNYLTEPQIETLMARSASGAINFKMHGIGRDLKALKKNDEH